MLRDSGMEESRRPKIAELRKFMLNRPSKAVMARNSGAPGASADPLAQPYISPDVGYAQALPGQKSRKVRNLMLQSPFKSMLARTAIFALVLALAISFVTVGLAPSATAQSANDDPCEADTTANPVTVECDYDENDDAPVANFSGMDPEGESIAWSLAGADAEDFDITGGVLTFKSSPNYEDPKGSGDPADNSYDVEVIATEVRSPGSLDLAQSTRIIVTVNVMNVEEDPTVTLNRLQVRAGVTTPAATTITAELKDPDGPTGITYKWYVPKVSRPDLENDDHWSDAPGTAADATVGTVTHEDAIYTTHEDDAGKYLRVVVSYTDGADEITDDKAYARSAHPVAAVRAQNTAPGYPAGTSTSFTLSEHVAVGTVIGTVRGSDIDSSDILTHVLEPGADTGGPDSSNRNAGKFAIDPATGQIRVASKLDYETAPDATGDRAGTGNKDYTFTVTVYDPSGFVPPENTDAAAGLLVSSTGALTINVKVTDQNDAPGKPTVGVIATTATDPADDNRTPVVDRTASPLEPSYMVEENSPVKDVEDDTDTTDVNEAEFAVVIARFTVADGPTAADATDPDGSLTTGDVTDGDPASTLKLTAEGVDGGLFSLTDTADFGGDDDNNAYELVFKESPNYESPADADGNNMYHVTIVTADNEGASSELPLVIEVTNVNEPGKVTLSTTQPAVGEPITATLTDPDMKITDVEWQWGRSVTNGGFIPIQGATSDTYTPVMSVDDDPVTTENEGVDGDEGMYLEVTVTYADNESAEEDDPATTDVDERTREIKKASDNAVREAPDVNQPPAFESGITREVPEDAGDGGKVGSPVTASDPDAGDELAYSISGGADMGAFEIGSTTGQITVKKGTKLDFEGTQTTYVVEVTARDPFGMSASTMVTIMVTDANEALEVTTPGDPCEQDANTKAVTCDYDENGMDPVGTFSAMDPEGESIAWSLAGADAEDFDITGGVLTFKSSPNYEDPKGSPDTGTDADNTYEVMVVATEVRSPGSLDLAQSTEIMVTVTVMNVEEDPTVTLNRLQVRAGVTTPAATTITAELKDPDGPTGITYSWYVPKVNRPDLENDDHWSDAPGTAADATVGTVTHEDAIYTTHVDDAGKYLRVVVSYTDGADEITDDKAYARSAHPVAAVRAQNTAPGYPAGTSTSFTLSEHVAVGTVIGTVRGSDIDSSDILTHVLEPGADTGGPDSSNRNAGKFAIDPATGQIRVASKLDYETAPDATGDRAGTGNKDYTFTVTVYDPSGFVPPENTDAAAGLLVSSTGALTINVKVTDQNDAPGKPTPGLAPEDTRPSPAVARTPADPDDATMPSYVVPENHPVKDVAEDDTTTEIELRTAIVIATFAVADTPTATDPDGSTTTGDVTDGDPASTLKLTAEGVDGGLFNLTNTADFGGSATDTTFDLVFKESPNYESPADADGNNKYHVTIVTTDNEGASSELPLVIEVTNVNEPGKVTLSTTQPAVGEPITATLTDPDMKITDVEWQWGRSVTNGGFIPIQGATSDTYTPVMSVDDDPVTTENEGVDGDEGMYLEVTVTYADNESAEEDDPATTDVDERTREIKKASDNAVREAPDVNQPPAFESGITREVPEDAGDGGKVGSPVTASDPDGDALSYSISGGADMGAFEIGSTTGQITVKKGTKLDFEGTQTTYVVEVTARDPFGMSASTMVTIMVTDANEAPEVMLQPGGTTQPDDETVGGRANVSVAEGNTAVGDYTTTISSPTWSLSGVDAGDFSISGGTLSFRSAPDYEAPADANGDNVYMVTVMASGGGNMAELDVTVTVTNDTSDDQTGGGFDPLSYDRDGSGEIERPEVIMAIRDYFDDGISQADVRAVIAAYFAAGN